MAVNVAAANREALERLCRARPAWTGVRLAREALGLDGRQLLHAGPPIGWDRMCGPMRGAVRAAILFEGWARSAEEADTLAGSGEVTFAPATIAARSGRWPASSRRARPSSSWRIA